MNAKRPSILRSKLATSNYKGFSLIELLVVMAVIFILITMGIYAFVGFREAISLNETTNNIAQDLRTAQRAAMFLDRDADERWLYGIGIDFNSYNASDSTPARYKVFKWCSPFSEFGEPPTRQNVPNFFNSGYAFATGNIPGSGRYVSNCEKSLSCENNAACNALTEINEQRPAGLSSGLRVQYDQKARFVLYEAVTGRAFLYDASGALLNYTRSGGRMTPVGNPENFKISLVAPVSGNKTSITVNNISGIVKIDRN